MTQDPSKYAASVKNITGFNKLLALGYPADAAAQIADHPPGGDSQVAPSTVDAKPSTTGSAGSVGTSSSINAPIDSNTGQPRTAAQVESTKTSSQPIKNDGSIVDLLNSQGQKSDINARKTLAEQYGINNYTGSADQNKALIKKYTEAHQTLSASGQAPDVGSAGRSAVSGVVYNQPQPTQDPINQAVNDSISNTIESVNVLTSYESTMQSVGTFQKSDAARLGIPALQAQDLNLKTIMSGTEDDVRDEITKAGGFSTESQVEAIAATRNKTLIKQLTNIENMLALSEQTLSLDVNAFQGDQTNALSSLRDSVSNNQSILSILQGVQTTHNDSLWKMVSSYGGFGVFSKMDDQSKRLTEASLHLPSGFLDSPAGQTGKTQLERVTSTDAYGNQITSVIAYDKETGRPIGSSMGSGAGGPVVPASSFVSGSANSYVQGDGVNGSGQPPVTTGYTVVKGDDLPTIAKNNGTDLQTILNLNPTLQGQQYIYPGQKIKLPPAAQVPDFAQASPDDPSVPASWSKLPAIDQTNLKSDVHQSPNGIFYLDATSATGAKLKARYNSVAGELGIPVITDKTQIQNLTNLTEANDNVDAFSSLVTPILSADWLSRDLGGYAKMTVEQFLQSNPKLGSAKTFNLMVSNLSMAITGISSSRGGGNMSTLVQYIPQVTDSLPIFQANIKNLKIMLDNREGAVLGHKLKVGSDGHTYIDIGNNQWLDTSHE